MSREHKGGGQGSNQFRSRGQSKQRDRAAGGSYQAASALDAAASSGAVAVKRFEDGLVAQAVSDEEWSHPESKRVTTSTPWGQADHSESYGRGVVNYHCPGHGGFLVSAGAAQKMHPAMVSIGDRYGDRWAFEEDDAWTAVAVSRPDLFPKSHVEIAVRMLKDYYPDQWMEFSGEDVDLDESSTLRERAFLEENEGGFISRTTTIQTEGVVEIEFARVSEGRVGRERFTLSLPAEEYQQRAEDSLDRGRFGFDPEKDESRVVSRVRSGLKPEEVQTDEEKRIWLEDNPDRPRFTKTGSGAGCPRL